MLDLSAAVVHSAPPPSISASSELPQTLSPSPSLQTDTLRPSASEPSLDSLPPIPPHLFTINSSKENSLTPTLAASLSPPASSNCVSCSVGGAIQGDSVPPPPSITASTTTTALSVTTSSSLPATAASPTKGVVWMTGLVDADADLNHIDNDADYDEKTLSSITISDVEAVEFSQITLSQLYPDDKGLDGKVCSSRLEINPLHSLAFLLGPCMCVSCFQPLDLSASEHELTLPLATSQLKAAEQTFQESQSQQRKQVLLSITNPILQTSSDILQQRLSRSKFCLQLIETAVCSSQLILPCHVFRVLSYSILSLPHLLVVKLFLLISFS